MNFLLCGSILNSEILVFECSIHLLKITFFNHDIQLSILIEGCLFSLRYVFLLYFKMAYVEEEFAEEQEEQEGENFRK